MEYNTCKYCGIKIFSRNNDITWEAVDEKDYYGGWALTLCRGREDELGSWQKPPSTWHEPLDRLVELARDYIKKHGMPD